jgi:hypothetical protein
MLRMHARAGIGSWNVQPSTCWLAGKRQNPGMRHGFWVRWCAVAVVSATCGCEGGGQTGDVGVSCGQPCPERISERPLSEATASDIDIRRTYEGALGATGDRSIDTVLVGPAALWSHRDLVAPDDRTTPARLTLRSTGVARHRDREMPEVVLCEDLTCEDFDELLVEAALELPELSTTLRGSGAIGVWSGQLDDGLFTGLVELDELGQCQLSIDPSGNSNELDCFAFDSVYTNRACVDEGSWRPVPVDPRSGLDLGAFLQVAVAALPIEVSCEGSDWNSEDPDFDPRVVAAEIVVPNRYCPSAGYSGVPVTLTLSGPAFPTSERLPAVAHLDADDACSRGWSKGHCASANVFLSNHPADVGLFELVLEINGDGKQWVHLETLVYAVAPEVGCSGQRVLE